MTGLRKNNSARYVLEDLRLVRIKWPVLTKVRNELKQLKMIYNDLKRSKNNLKLSKTTSNHLKLPKITNENLIDLWKVFFVLDFRMQVGTCFRTRDADLKTKTRPVARTLKPDVVIQSRPFKPLGPCKSEPLEKLKSNRLQMFFKIGI